MANSDRPDGFTPVGSIAGHDTNFMVNYYNIASDYAAAIFPGDVVKLAGNADADGVPTIEIAAVTDLPVGVVVSIEAKPASGLDQIYSPASELGYALVCDDPNAIFQVQMDDSGGADAMVADDIGQNFKHLATAGSTSSQRSRYELDLSTEATTNTFMWKLLRLAPIPGNSIGANAKVWVKFNVHAHSVDTGTTAT